MENPKQRKWRTYRRQKNKQSKPRVVLQEEKPPQQASPTGYTEPNAAAAANVEEPNATAANVEEPNAAANAEANTAANAAANAEDADTVVAWAT